MRFFDFNFAFKGFGCTYDASSNATIAEAGFDELENTYWESSGENTDGNSIYLEADYGVSRTTDRGFIRNTNISDAAIELWTGAAWVTPANYTSVRSTKGALYSYYVSFDSTPHTKIRAVGSNTTPANEEKQIQEIYSFSDLGHLNIPPSDINPKRIKEQNKHLLDNGKYYLFTRGRRWEIELKFKAHVGQDDIDLMMSLVNRDLEFYVWANDNEEAYMNYTLPPFLFENVIKVSIDKGDNPGYYKNLFFSGMDNSIKLIEVS